jgi:CheY-like chemotaxis protein
MLAARRCADLTGQLLAYAGRGQLVRAPVDLATLVHEVAALLRTAIPAGGALSIEVPAHAPPVRGDRAQLTQVVMNLVTNAADAIRAGGGTVALRMAEERLDARAIEALSLEAGVLDGKLVEGAYVRLSVADTGVGMSEEVRARMFEPFFTTKSTGRGLGLAATRGIVHAHGGALTVRSTLGRGTVVELWLPIDQAATGTAPELSHPCEKALARPLPRGSVLVVDDEATVRRILARIFAQQGLTVLEAADGRDALAVVEARAGAVDLVLLDLTMPVLGGAEAQKALATRYPEIPVVLMSGYADEPAGELVGACGEPAAFLRKPFERSAVMRVVEMALGQRKPPAALS